MTDVKKPRGFARMSKEAHRAICSQGGKAVHAQGVAYKFSAEKAKEAGRLGGLASHARRRAREAVDAMRTQGGDVDVRGA